jgi:hypothetical protein
MKDFLLRKGLYCRGRNYDDINGLSNSVEHFKHIAFLTPTIICGGQKFYYFSYIAFNQVVLRYISH